MQVGKGQWNRVLDMVSRIRGLGMEVASPLFHAVNHCLLQRFSFEKLHGYMIRGGSKECHTEHCSLNCLLVGR